MLDGSLNNLNISYAKIKLIFSSYSLMGNGARGFPDGKSDCDNCTNPDCKTECKSMKYSKPYDPNSYGYDAGDSSDWKEGVYTRVHRDIDIIKAMRSWLNLNDISNEHIHEDETKIVKELNYIPTTIPTTIPEVIPTTISTTLPEVIPTTIATTVPGIIPTTIYTTIPDMIPTITPSTIILPTTIVQTSVFTTIIETNMNNYQEKYYECDEESNRLNLCISCNREKDYYPVHYNNQIQKIC